MVDRSESSLNESRGDELAEELVEVSYETAVMGCRGLVRTFSNELRAVCGGSDVGVEDDDLDSDPNRRGWLFEECEGED